MAKTRKTNPGLFQEKSGPSANDVSLYTTFVVAPTLPMYKEIKNQGDFDKEFSTLVTMAKKDIGYVKEFNPFPDVIYTGYAGEENPIPLDDFLQKIASTKEPINIMITAHGSPGNKGKFGMGHDDPHRPDYRVDIDKLIKMLEDSGIGRLRGCYLHFYFRCCNSAYVPINRFEKSDEVIKQAVKEQSLIGYFWFEAHRKFPDVLISASGFRGYYYPGQKGVMLSGELSGKNQVSAKEGTITIEADGRVILPADAKYKKIQNKELDEKTLSNLHHHPTKYFKKT